MEWCQSGSVWDSALREGKDRVGFLKVSVSHLVCFFQQSLRLHGQNEKKNMCVVRPFFFPKEVLKIHLQEERRLIPCQAKDGTVFKTDCPALSSLLCKLVSARLFLEWTSTWHVRGAARCVNLKATNETQLPTGSMHMGAACCLKATTLAHEIKPSVRMLVGVLPY